jgi:ATP-dependent Clp protease ATP-binding subunit ClpC
LELTEEAKSFLIKKGTDLDYGARPLRRAIENFVEDPLSEELLRGEFQGVDTIIVTGFKDDDGKVTRLDLRGEKREEDPPVEIVGATSESGDAATGMSPGDEP